MTSLENTNEYPLVSELKPEEFTFSSLNKNATTLRQSAWINSPNSGEGVLFQSFDPKKGLGATLRVPFAPNEPDGEATKYSLSLSLEGDNADSLVEYLQSLDEKTVSESMKRATDYFKRPVTKVELLNMYCASLKQSSKEGYAPTMKLKVGDASQTKIHKAIVPLSECTSIGEVPYTKASIDDVIAQSRMHVSAKLGPLWFMKTRFGVTLNAKEILLDKPASEGSEPPTSFSFGKRKLNDTNIEDVGDIGDIGEGASA